MITVLILCIACAIYCINEKVNEDYTEETVATVISLEKTSYDTSDEDYGAGSGIAYKAVFEFKVKGAEYNAVDTSAYDPTRYNMGMKLQYIVILMIQQR